MRPDRVEAGIAAALEQSTRSLHRQAERTGIIRDLLQGRASRYGYALLLRNLLPAYQQLEQGLESRRHGAAIGAIALQGLFRASAITADLDQLGGREWRETLPLLAAGRHYADRVADATKGDGTLLIAHAYVRYMGDLSGGQILKRLLGRSLQLPPPRSHFTISPPLTISVPSKPPIDARSMAPPRG
jgi:heme oxygenase